MAWGLKADREELDTLHQLLARDTALVFPEEAPEVICLDTGSTGIVLKEPSKPNRLFIGSANFLFQKHIFMVNGDIKNCRRFNLKEIGNTEALLR